MTMSKLAQPGIVALKKKDRDLVARKLADRLAYKRNDIRGDIKTYAQFLHEQTEALGLVEETVGQEAALFAEAVAKLRAARVKFTVSYGWRLEVETTKKSLKKVYEALGRLDGSKQGKEILDAGKKLVKVTLPVVAYPEVYVSFPHKLTESDKCRIETVTETRTRLVCKRD
jgi:hypothetical protein